MRSCRRKSSANVTLVLIGTITLASCGDEVAQQRDVYSSLDACAKDWGRTEQCEKAPAEETARHGSSYSHLGPRYSSRVDSTGKPLSSNNASRSVSVSRGGFGSSAGLHGGGG